MKKVFLSGVVALSSLLVISGQTDASAKSKPAPKVSVTYRMVDSRTGAVLRTQKITYNKNAKAIKSYSLIYGYNTPKSTNFKVTYSQMKTIKYVPKQFTITNRFYNTVTHTYLANQSLKAYYNQSINDAPTVSGYIRPTSQRFVVKGNVTRIFNVLANKGTLQNPLTLGTAITLSYGDNKIGFYNSEYTPGAVAVKLQNPGYRTISTRTMNDYLAYSQQRNYPNWRETYLFGAQQLTLPMGNSWLSVPIHDLNSSSVIAVRVATKNGTNILAPLSIQSDKLMYLSGEESPLTTKLYGSEDNSAWTDGGTNSSFGSYVNDKAMNAMYFRVPNTVMTQDLRIGFQLSTGQWIYYRPMATQLY